MSRNLIVVSGPTGIGKTETCYKLSKIYGGHIISADSRQIYKEISIGTAKPSKQEIIDNHIKVVDHVSIFEDYSVGQFEREALAEIEKDFESNGSSILSGGTGLYVQAVCHGLNKFPDIKKETVLAYNTKLIAEGLVTLQEELKSRDIEYYEKVDLFNSRRIIRALCVIEESNQTYTSFVKQELPPRDFNTIHICLAIERSKLYERINNRVLKMIKAGLIEEAKSVHEHKSLKSLQTVGYQEFFDYFDGKTTKDEAIAKVQMNSRRYAKRQTTWLNKYVKGSKFAPTQLSNIKKFIEGNLK